MKYLYGAAVQGIQSFIFQTNELKDIVGASELVENICTVEFAKELYGVSMSEALDKNHERIIMDKLAKDRNAVLNAAGNIKYIFQNKALCEEMVMNFPRRILNYAPGITISQAVVEYDEANESDAVDLLERRLRVQRNKPLNSITNGLMGIHRSRGTNLPCVLKVSEQKSEEEYMDAATLSKRYHLNDDRIIRKRTTRKLCLKAFDISDIAIDTEHLRNSQIAFDTEDLTDNNNWIAVIHADGNGVGQIVSKIGTNLNDFKEFSKALDKATTEAAVAAYDAIKQKYSWKKVIPIRPVVIGGDDFTVICRADLAIDYVADYIRNFEKHTQNGKVGELLRKYNIFTKGEKTDCLTACAGIAYIKSSYPFYYGYELAESLCTRAKKDAKNSEDVRNGHALPHSCIMFHKVQASFVESYDDIVKRELTPCNGVSFEFGPYYLSLSSANEKGKWTVDNLISKAKELNSVEGNMVKSSLRNWMSLLCDGQGAAKQRLDRIMNTTPMKEYVANVTTGIAREDIVTYPTYDILAIHTINTQVTKNEEEE